ncbi:hypothetical protein J1N35_022787 [Gossypium stocksii]|uniref:Uncharacterized protein n=1 Tax=Gossypium stocksii TaxID=47602 RepID=A0A9D3VHW5_9ROSI|nr:hypothetical protein J1N35_022787 [Gossypium stocksii]
MTQLEESTKDEYGLNHHGPTLHEASKIIQDPLQVPIRPIMRARAKCFKEALNGLMCGLWSQA